jgi:transposase-like protein
MNMMDNLALIQKSGGIEPKHTHGMNSKYSDEYKNEAIKLIVSLGGRNRAAKQLGIAPSLITSFRKQKDEGRF